MTRTRQAHTLTELAHILADEAEAYCDSQIPLPLLTIVNADTAPLYTLLIVSRA